MRAAPPWWAEPVAQVRIAIVVAILILWEAMARSGMLYQDVVPSLLANGGEVVKLLRTQHFYGNI
jgi:hypothetical protein